MVALGIAAAAMPLVLTGSNPNIIVILSDDQGFGDLGCYGARGFTTPHIDSLYAGGMHFTNFYDAMSTSSPSRAGLLTGCYPPRVGIDRVLGSRSPIGLDPSVMTLPQMLRDNGYSTLAVGKWHLGALEGALPTNHGFDEFYGVPYSNDMSPFLLKHNTSTLYEITDQSQLTTLYTEKCVDFIRHSEDGKPFFLYMAHSMPHIPLAVSDKFKGKSERGLYGDVVMEIDWSVGEIMRALRERGIEENTLVVVTSDNGPWLIYGDHAGSAGPYRDGKFSRFEGGMRQYCIMYWKGHIAAGSACDAICSNMDFFPTFASLAGAAVPEEVAKRLDGIDMTPLLAGSRRGGKRYECFFYMFHERTLGVRSGRWKLMLPQSGKRLVKGGTGGERGIEEKISLPLALYDLKHDPGETTDVSAKHPRIVRRLQKAIAEFDSYVAATSIPAKDYSK